MREGINAILKSHAIDLDTEILDPLLDDFIEYFNSVYKPDDTIPYFHELVGHYKQFYRELTNGEECAFNPIQAINLKRLTQTLQKRYLHKHPESIWDSNTALRQLDIFYKSATTLPFYKSCFSATMLYSKFDEIISQLAAIKQRETNGK